jgi:hypothetical protein
MTYTEQIEQYVAYYPQTVRAEVPASTGVTSLPAYPQVEVVSWDHDFCELVDADGVEIARFRLVG